MYKCKKCGKEYENRYSYIGHCSSHNRGENYKKDRKLVNSRTIKINKAKICKYCEKEFDTGWSLGGHQTWCDKNPNKKETSKKLSESNKGKVLSKKTKDKISKSRKNYLDNNPGQIPYLLNHSSKESYPEKIFREALEKRKIIGWEYNYTIKRYCLDFAFTDKKIDIEIDGGTHNLPEVIKKDKIRDETLKHLNWTVIRFTAKEVKYDVNKCIDKIINTYL